MHHYIAFLRGMNLGHRRITMDQLRGYFEELKFAEVTTFIASGNVIFSSPLADPRQLTAKIQKHLASALGYEVDTFLRTRAEVAAVATFRAFPQGDFAHPDHMIHAGFVADRLSAAQARGLVDCRTDVDDFCVEGREYYWRCRIKSHESKVWTSPGLKALKLPSSSMRNLTTVRTLAALYPVRPCV
ncbi:MAG: DUF1697 domain-containing protein [Opitutaceae bacterium]